MRKGKKEPKASLAQKANKVKKAKKGPKAKAVLPALRVRRGR